MTTQQTKPPLEGRARTVALYGEALAALPVFTRGCVIRKKGWPPELYAVLKADYKAPPQGGSPELAAIASWNRSTWSTPIFHWERGKPVPVVKIVCHPPEGFVHALLISPRGLREYVARHAKPREVKHTKRYGAFFRTRVVEALTLQWERSP